jgi:hypothetical protein
MATQMLTLCKNPCTPKGQLALLWEHTPTHGVVGNAMLSLLACFCHTHVFLMACKRYLTEHMDKVSLGLMARLVTTNDAAMALLPLLDRPPWVRR